jgi:hypothetical protein
MANVEYKAGAYQIGPSTSQQFTFWWGAGSFIQSEYFDVSIAPDYDPNRPRQPLALIEEQRSYVLDTSEDPVGKIVLLLTLRNDNDFPVYFTANHVRIYTL